MTSRLGTLLTLLTLALLAASTSLQAEATSAPPWELKDLDGKTHKLSDYKGQVVVLNIWATWCPPCRRELPDFVELQNKYGGKGVSIIGMSVDSIAPKEVASFAKENNLTYPIVMTDESTAENYGAGAGIPQTFIVNAQGKVVYHTLGGIDKGVVETQIDRLLAAKIRRRQRCGLASCGQCSQLSACNPHPQSP